MAKGATNAANHRPLVNAFSKVKAETGPNVPHWAESAKDSSLVQLLKAVMPSWFNNGLVFASYAVLITAISVTLYRAAGLAPEQAVLIGAVLLLLAGQVHALAGRIQERAENDAEIRALRSVTATMSRDLDRMAARVADLEGALDAQTALRNEQLSSEVRLVETLVKGLAESVEAGISGKSTPRRRASDRAATPPPDQVRLPLETEPAHGLTEGELIETIRASLEENRADLYLQPVVTLPQRKTRFYEGLTRLRGQAGEVIMPGDYMRVAEPAGMMPVVDNLLLFRCVQVVRRLVARSKETGVFCNISIHSLLDSDFFPQFVEFMEHNRDLAGHLYFEFSQGAVDALGPIERASLDALSSLGFRFSLDQVRRLDMNLGKLYDMGFRYVKVPADMLLGDLRGTGAHVRAEDMRSLFERNGLELIAERIEDERQAVAVLDLNIAYGQGYLFGEPRPVREDALSAPTEPGIRAASA